MGAVVVMLGKLVPCQAEFVPLLPGDELRNLIVVAVGAMGRGCDWSLALQ